MVSLKAKTICIATIVTAVAIAILVIGLYFGLRNTGGDDSITIDSSGSRCDTIKPSELKGNGKFCACGKDSGSNHNLQDEDCFNIETKSAWCFAHVCSKDECTGLCKAVLDFGKNFYEN
jgi:hypothetical protein